MKIAIAACMTNPILSASNEQFRQSLIKLGVDVPVLHWNRDSFAAFLECDLVMLRQTWDYQIDPGGFAAWLVRLEALGSHVESPSQLAIWNNDKRTICELGDKGISIPQTVNLPLGAEDQSESVIRTDKIVLKPAFGGGGTGVTLCDRATFGQALARVRSDIPGRPYMAQEFLPEIAQGEWKISCINGRAMLAVHATPQENEFRINSRFDPHIELAQAPVTAKECAERIMELVGTPLCGRVDGVMRDGEFICTELELTDPDLHLHYDSKVADVLASSSVTRAKAGPIVLKNQIDRKN